MPYPLLCALLGVAIGWWPRLVHGPIPYKYNIHGLNGALAVWGWYVARSLIGLLVGITIWPRQWWLRGPLCGILALVPLGFVSLATPECGSACMFWNTTTAAATGAVVGGVAYLITGRHHGGT